MYGGFRNLTDITTYIGVLRILTVVGILIATAYIFYEWRKWSRFSQGLKPMLSGLGLFLIITVMNCLKEDCSNINYLLNFLTIQDYNKKFGLLRLISFAYILILSGLEIFLIVFFKRIRKLDGGY